VSISIYLDRATLHLKSFIFLLTCRRGETTAEGMAADTRIDAIILVVLLFIDTNCIVIIREMLSFAANGVQMHSAFRTMKISHVTTTSALREGSCHFCLPLLPDRFPQAFNKERPTSNSSRNINSGKEIRSERCSLYLFLFF